MLNFEVLMHNYMSFPESAKDFFSPVKCCLFTEHWSFFVFETDYL